MRQQGRHHDDIAHSRSPQLQIVSYDLWIAGRMALDRRGFSVVGSTKSNTYLLALLTQCDRCGTRMRIFAHSDIPEKKYYDCRRAYGASKGCTQIRIRADWVEKAVIHAVQERLVGSPDAADFRAAYDAECRTKRNYRTEAIEKLNREIYEIEEWFEAELRNAVALQGIPSNIVLAYREKERLRLAGLKQLRQALMDEPLGASSVEKLDALEKEIAHLKSKTPLKIVTSEDAALAEAFRRFVRKVEIGDSDRDGARTITVIMDLTHQSIAEAEPSQVCNIAVECKVCPGELSAAERNARAVRIAEELKRAGEDTTYDIPEDAWREIRDLAAEERVVLRVGDPKRVLNGVLWYLRTRGAKFENLPIRFGEPGAFRSALRRLIYCGAWDNIVEILQHRFPNVLRGCNVQRLAGTHWSRRGASIIKASLVLEVERPKLESLLQERTDRLELRRMRSAREYLDGKSISEIARQEQISKTTVRTTLVRFSHGGARGLLNKAKSRTRASRALLSAVQLRELIAIVS
jgi:hypothetical protein